MDEFSDITDLIDYDIEDVYDVYSDLFYRDLVSEHFMPVLMVRHFCHDGFFEL